MRVVLLPSFIADIQNQMDANFAKRVFRKVFDAEGTFKPDGNDHRYEGIPNAWIRYVSMGSSAFRVIYIKDEGNIWIYRAGPHSVEDRLSQPKLGVAGVEVSPGSVNHVDSEINIQSLPRENVELGGLISSLRTPILSQMILGRRLIPHKEVTLVSPFLSTSLFGRMARFGRMLDDFIEDGTKVNLVTRPPDLNSLEFFKDLESRGIELLFHARLHAKLYVFTVDEVRLTHGRRYNDLVVLGSANLTESGFGATRETGNEELCYEIPTHERKDVESYLGFLALNSVDLTKLRVEASRVKRRI